MNKAELLNRLSTPPEGRVLRMLHTVARVLATEGTQIVRDAVRRGINEIETTPVDDIQPEHPGAFARRHLRDAVHGRYLGNRGS